MIKNVFFPVGSQRHADHFKLSMTIVWEIDPFHVRENVSKLEDKTKEI